MIRLTFATKHRIFASTLWLTALVSAGAVVLDWRAKRQQVLYAEDSHWDSPNLAPFVTAPHEVVSRMLELAQIEKRDALYDLGSGDGRIVVAAAKSMESKRSALRSIRPW